MALGGQQKHGTGHHCSCGYACTGILKLKKKKNSWAYTTLCSWSYKFDTLGLCASSWLPRGMRETKENTIFYDGIPGCTSKYSPPIMLIHIHLIWLSINKPTNLQFLEF